MRCSICSRDNVTVVVPPNATARYCLECILRDISEDWRLPERARHVVRVIDWVESRGHRIPESRLTIDKPKEILCMPGPPMATRSPDRTMRLSKLKDFVHPTLRVLETLGGEASLKEIEETFYKSYSARLDPSKDWNRITPNHSKQLWRDYCGSRVIYHHLRPEGYVTLEMNAGRNSTYRLTDKGRAKLEFC